MPSDIELCNYSKLLTVGLQRNSEATGHTGPSPQFSENIGNHGPIIRAPVAPHIAPPVPSESAMQTVMAITVTAVAVTGSTTEAATKAIAAKTITSDTITAAAGKRVGTPGTSENKDNCDNNYGVA